MAPIVSQLFSSISLLFLLFPVLSHGEQSPFEFLEHLQGCHKGENVKGVHKLKKYLENFGYLHYDQNNTHANDDNFDDLLESAIKTYQLNYHLNTTGILDAQTVSKMVMPRCGVADIINGTNWMRVGKKWHHHGHGNSTFHTVSHYSFFPNNPKWPPSKTHLTYGFLPGTRSDAVGPVTRAFNNWAANTHFTFSQTQDIANADLEIGFYRGNHGDGSSFDGPGGVLAHAFAPTVGWFHYDADENWVVGAVPGGMDLETVALHEIGHLLGLGHSEVQDAIMFSSLTSGVTKGLHGDDIAGIKALYNK